MVCRIYGVAKLRTFLLLLLFGFPLALSAMPNPRSSVSSSVSSGQINSNSVLVALLDSHYTELGELVEKAMLLQTLEDTVGSHNITIFAPRNEALERDLDPEFKRFLLEPGNLKSLQTLLMFHIIPTRIGSEQLLTRTGLTRHDTLSNDHLHLENNGTTEWTVDRAKIIQPDAVTRPDGVIHGIERLWCPVPCKTTSTAGEACSLSRR
ncbi:hypothetical protein K1719_044691 [Acacia pycnantha]|nr:hypothetical protein K1719_044691 [Acacia pycnantha]